MLTGVDQTVNTGIQWAERLAGRKTFLRWALTKEVVRECDNFPPCSDGFNSLNSLLEPVARTTKLGRAIIRAYPVKALVDIAQTQIATDPLALLCTRSDCPRCDAVRKKVAQSDLTQRIYAEALVE